jgi:hypothetical protein
MPHTRSDPSRPFAWIIHRGIPLRVSFVFEEYIRPDGTNPYRTWFDSLDPQAAKVVTAALRLELGHTSKVTWFAGIGEYVIDWGSGFGSILPRTATRSLYCLEAARSAGNRRI